MTFSRSAFHSWTQKHAFGWLVRATFYCPVFALGCPQMRKPNWANSSRTQIVSLQRQHHRYYYHNQLYRYHQHHHRRRCSVIVAVNRFAEASKGVSLTEEVSDSRQRDLRCVMYEERFIASIEWWQGGPIGKIIKIDFTSSSARESDEIEWNAISILIWFYFRTFLYDTWNGTMSLKQSKKPFSSCKPFFI